MFAEDRLEQAQKAWVLGEACGGGGDSGGGSEGELGSGRAGWKE